MKAPLSGLFVLLGLTAWVPALGAPNWVIAGTVVDAGSQLPLIASWDDAQLIIAEAEGGRRRELYLEGHRLNDMLRWDLPFQTGAGYGTTARLPLPRIEIDNNPNMQGLNTSPPWRCQR